MVTRSSVGERIAVRLPALASERLHRELGAFARYCIARIERELGRRGAWAVSVMPAPGGFASEISVREARSSFTERGQGLDGTLAIWDAMCRLEQRLRSHHADT